MPPLSSDECHLLLKLLGQEVVMKETKEFPYRIVKDGFGYSKDKLVGGLQAKLSIALEVAGKMGR